MPVWGMMSPKFVVHAGILLLSARVELHPLKAALDPSAPVTTISSELAGRVGVPATNTDEVEVTRDRVVAIGGKSYRLRSVRVSARTEPAPVVIGADLLKRRPLILDFSRNRLEVVDESNRGLLQGAVLANARRGLTATPLATSAGGCLSLSGESPDGRRVTLALVGTTPEPAAPANDIRIKVGDVTLQGQIGSAAASRCRVDGVIHWEGFGRRRIMIDAPHGSLWLG